MQIEGGPKIHLKMIWEEDDAEDDRGGLLRSKKKAKKNFFFTAALHNDSLSHRIGFTLARLL